MDHRQVVRILATLRVGIGAVLLLVPGAAGKRWIGEPAADARVKAVIRGLGARDLALGLGALRALDRGEPAQPWVQLAAVGDATDAVAALAGARRLGALRTLGTVVSAGAAAAIGFVAAAEVDEGNRPA